MIFMNIMNIMNTMNIKNIRNIIVQVYFKAIICPARALFYFRWVKKL